MITSWRPWWKPEGYFLRCFDEDQLGTELTAVPITGRVAFAAACAERLAPSYRRFVERTGRGDADAHRRNLDRVWAALVGSGMREEEISESLSFCMGLTPREDDGPWVPEQASAEDACAALAYTLRCYLEGSPREAAWAARRAYEAAHQSVVHALGMEGDAPIAEDRVLDHQVVQAELTSQELDLRELRATPECSMQEAIARMRERAIASKGIEF